MDKLKVVELQAQLAKRNMDVRGTKTILVSRLMDVIESEGISVEEFVSSLQKRQHVVADKVASTVPDKTVNDTSEKISQNSMSNSNISTVSAVESIRAELAKECARAAGLKAKAEFSRRKYELLQKELHMKLQLDYECEQLQLQGEIAEANACKQILAEKQRELSLIDPAPVDNAKSLLPQNNQNQLACSSSNPCTSGTGLLTPTHANRPCNDTDLNGDTVAGPADLQNPVSRYGHQQNQRIVDSTQGIHGRNSNGHETSLAQALIDQSRRNLLPKSSMGTLPSFVPSLERLMPESVT